jgi:Uma2 family endonuclease
MSQTNLAAIEPLYTVEEYLAFEREAKTKHEYYDGEIIQIAGATEAHNLISSNIFGTLWIQLRGKPFRIYGSDMRIRAGKTKYVYSDAVVVAGKPELTEEKPDVLLNPKVIVEVLSESTKWRDKTEKLDAYLALESVSDCILIEQDRMRVEHYNRKNENGWHFQILTKAEQKLILTWIECEVSLSEIYLEVEFPPNDLEETEG